MEEILKFLSSNKDALTVLLSFSVFVLGAGFLGTATKWIGAYLKYRRERLIPVDTFPFKVIKPGSEKVIQQLIDGSGEDENDALADFNIPYQIRQPDRNVRQELERLLDEKHWVLVLGRTGLGKTREVAELAQLLNHEGWTVLNLTEQDWLDVPRYFPKDKIGSTRKLLFFLDDLNGWMYRGQKELSPKAEQPFQPLKVPRQERLLSVLEFYEDVCRPENIRVLATARDEKERAIAYKASEWEKLEFENYPQLWKRFHLYNLAEPEDQAIVDLLNEVVPKSGIQAHSENYLKIAQRNDRTFRNIVENLQTARNRNWSLAPEKFPETLDKTWSKRYRRAVEEYPAARYIYDAIDLLRSLNIALYDFTVAPTARMLAGGNWLQRILYRWKIYIALHYLIRAERILEPRDGQIEAKGQEIEVGEYISSVTDLILRLAISHPQEMLMSLAGFAGSTFSLKRYQESLKGIDLFLKLYKNFDMAWSFRAAILYNLERYEEAIANYHYALELDPNDDWTLYGQCLVLDSLGRYEEAIASYDQLLKIQPNHYEAWFLRGTALCKIGRYEEAITSCDQALGIKPDYYGAWFSRGVALSKLGQCEEAIASYDNALKFQASHNAWFNRGGNLFKLQRYEEAIASYDQALQIQPDDYQSWNNQAAMLLMLGRYEDAIASHDKALQIKSDYHEAWYGKACCYGLKGDFEQAISHLQIAIQLSPEKYRDLAKGNAIFDSIRDDARFQLLMSEIG